MNFKEKSMKPKREAFKCDKVKLVKDGGLDCHFEVQETVGQEVYTEKYHTESSKDLHPDLMNGFNSLKPMLARIFHLSFFREIIANKDFKATEAQSRFAEKFYQEILAKVNVTGIALSGQDQNAGVIISGTFTADTNQKMAINSHRIRFTDTKYGFEEDLELTVDEIIDEVYAFLFDNKRAQLSLFDQPEARTIFDGKAAAAGVEKEEEDDEPEMDESWDDEEEQSPEEAAQQTEIWKTFEHPEETPGESDEPELAGENV